MKHEISIPNYRTSSFLKKMLTLAKKADKYGIEGFEVNFLHTKEVVKKIADLPSESLPVDIFDVYEISAPVISVGPWKFVATIDTTTKVHTIHTAPGETCPVEYAEGEVRCDHCNKIRARHNTYVVRNTESGEMKMVGSACLKDYLGVDPKVVARNFEFHRTVEEFGEHDDNDRRAYGRRGEYFEPLGRLLRATAAVALRKGFYSRSAIQRIIDKMEKDEIYGEPIGHVPEATSSIAWGWCLARTWKMQHDWSDAYKIQWADLFEGIEDDVEKLVAEGLEWAKSLDMRASEFNWNLNAVLVEDKVWHRTLGTAAYIIGGAMNKRRIEAEEKAKRADKPESKWVGKVGERTKATVTVTFERVVEGGYGTTYLYKMVTSDGGELTWFASQPALEVEKEYTLAFRVKKHDEFRGVKQTVITRAKVM